jgi:hypothetical protein
VVALENYKKFEKTLKALVCKRLCHASTATVFRKDLNMSDKTQSLPTAWWYEENFIKELDETYRKWETGEEQGCTLAEANALIDDLRQKRKNALR